MKKLLLVLLIVGVQGGLFAADRKAQPDDPVSRCQRACPNGDDRSAYEACMLKCREAAPKPPTQ